MSQIEVCGGAAIVVIFLACIVCGYILHMWHILRDIAQEDAENEADRLFHDYVDSCEYRVHFTFRVVDEMKGAQK